MGLHHEFLKRIRFIAKLLAQINSEDSNVPMFTPSDFSIGMGSGEGSRLAAPVVKKISSEDRDVPILARNNSSIDMGPRGGDPRLTVPGVKRISSEDRNAPMLTLSDFSIEEDLVFWCSEEWQKSEAELRRRTVLAILRAQEIHLRVATSRVRFAQHLAKWAQELAAGSADMFDTPKALDENEPQLKPEPLLQPPPLPQHVISPPANSPLNPASPPTASGGGTHSPAERSAPPDLPCRSIPQAAPEGGNNGARGTLSTLNGQDNGPFTGRYGDEQLLGQSPFVGSSHNFGLAEDPGAWLEEDISKILEGVEFDIDDATQVLGMEVI